METITLTLKTVRRCERAGRPNHLSAQVLKAYLSAKEKDAGGWVEASIRGVEAALGIGYMKQNTLILHLESTGEIERKSNSPRGRMIRVLNRKVKK